MHVRTRQEAKRVRVLNIKRTRENEKLSRVLFRSKFLGMGWGLLVTVDDVGDKVQGFFQFLPDVALHSRHDGEFHTALAIP